MNNEENTLPTHHHKIMIAKITENPPLDFLPIMFGQLEDALNEYSEKELVKTMKSIVPEYISNMSRFESLDSPNQETKNGKHTTYLPIQN